MSGDLRRRSARLGDKEDSIPIASGADHSLEHLTKTSSSSRRQAEPVVAKSTNGTKRKPAYDEEDDGFTFTRKKSKKAKPEPAKPAPIEGEQDQQISHIIPKKKKRFEDRPSVNEANDDVPIPKRRSTRNSGGSQADEEPSQVPLTKRRKSRTLAGPAEPSRLVASSTNVAKAGPTPTRSDATFDSTKISLPFADTPIIRRNKEMRKSMASNSRRSSLGMRGRRASSLIDAGKSNAVPHDEVESAEFYKHIESEGLTEPRRMRQLLTWCGTRALGEKPSIDGQDSNAILAAREIQSQLLRDFSARSSLSDWFSRIDDPALPSPPRPNPKNLTNLTKIKDLEQQLARLRAERASWNSFTKPPTIEPLPTSTPTDSGSGMSEADLKTIDKALLAPSSLDILNTTLNPNPTSKTHLSPSQISSTTSDAISQRLQTLTAGLEFSIDNFATNIHALSSYSSTAAKLAEESLAGSASFLEERDHEGSRRANEGTNGKDVRDVLRSLSRVVQE